MKSCARCQMSVIENKAHAFFPKDKRKLEGLAHTCKSCKSLERRGKADQELARWKRNYAPGTEARKKHIIRGQTRKKYGSAKHHLCKTCGNQAAEWHHTEYKVDSVIPLCEGCHELE